MYTRIATIASAVALTLSCIEQPENRDVDAGRDTGADISQVADAFSPDVGVDVEPDAACVPRTCEGICGTVDDDCGDTLACDPCGAAAKIEVSPLDPHLLNYESMMLSAEVFDEDGASIPDAEVVWSVDDAAVLRGGTTGDIQGQGVGEATVTATVSGTSLSAAVQVTVEEPQFFDMTVGVSHSCGLTGSSPEGRAYCWGRGPVGVAGWRLSTFFHLSRVETEQRFAEISAGEAHTCAITADRAAVYCWGDNQRGQLGRASGNGSAQPIPVDLGGASNLSEITAGLFHTCVTAGTNLWCWGDNASNRASVEDDSDPLLPHLNATYGAVERLALAYEASCAAVAGDMIKCWGRDELGQLGDGAPDSSGQLVTWAYDYSVREMDGLEGTFCLVTDGNRAWCWGDNQASQLSAAGGSLAEAVLPFGSVAIRHVAVGQNHMCVLPSGDMSAIRCRGQDAQMADDGHTVLGVLGPSATDSLATQTVMLPVQVDAGSRHTCVIDEQPGRAPIRCWGDNSLGQLGDGAASDSATATEAIAGLSM